MGREPLEQVPYAGLNISIYMKRQKPPPLKWWRDEPEQSTKPKRKKSNRKRGRAGGGPMRAVRLLDPICRYCMVAPTTTADHVVPKSRGGSNSRLNLVGACFPCNHRKGNKTPKEAGMKLYLPLRFYSYVC